MKRFFILASAAIVALASCAKTEVVYKDAPEKITFKQVTDVMTKATNLSDQLTLGVFANEEDGDVYFGNTAFTYSEGTWGNNSAYWPYEGNLVFTVYAPAGTAAYVETEVE